MMTMANAPGWQPDPERGDQERYWSGSAWTDRVRPARKAASSRVPEHGPQLQRALAAATVDIDAVEDRLSTLFERTDGTGHRGSSSVAPPPPSRAASDDGIIELFDDGDGDVDDMDEVVTGGQAVAEPHEGSDDDDATNDTFADLDAELAAEAPVEPGKAKRRMFRRSAKGTESAQS